MLRPSYSELMGIVNQDEEMDSKITSRYSIVIAAAKRARQIIDGAEHDSFGVQTDKAVSIAINEMLHGKVRIVPEGLSEEGQEGGKEPGFRARPPAGVSFSAGDVIQGEDMLDYGDLDEDEYFEEAEAGDEFDQELRSTNEFRGYDFDNDLDEDIDDDIVGKKSVDDDDMDENMGESLEEMKSLEMEDDDEDYGGGDGK